MQFFSMARCSLTKQVGKRTAQVKPVTEQSVCNHGKKLPEIEFCKLLMLPDNIAKLALPRYHCVVQLISDEEAKVDSEAFSNYRKKLGKTQKEIAGLLGVSLKTIHSYEQGWRKIPSYIERQMFFLLSNRRGKLENASPCWEIKQCGMKEQCPAWEFQCGHLCWFIPGTLCGCTEGCSLEEKTVRCRSCDILKSRLE